MICAVGGAETRLPCTEEIGGSIPSLYTLGGQREIDDLRKQKPI